MPALVVNDLWWPFGAHLLHVKLRKIYAIVNGLKFYYKHNNYPVFPDGNVEYYFAPWSDNIDGETDFCTIQQDIWTINFPVPPEYKNIEDFHSKTLAALYHPSANIKEYIINHPFLKKLVPDTYIAMHVRWTDKTAGPAAETNMIDVSVYLDKCVQIRKETGIANLVICSDTHDAIAKIEELNKSDCYNFNLMYNADEVRSRNDPSDAFVQKVDTLTLEERELVYKECFINMETLIQSYAIVANFDSGFALVAVQIRNKIGRDVNVQNRKARWGLHQHF